MYSRYSSGHKYLFEHRVTINIYRCVRYTAYENRGIIYERWKRAGGESSSPFDAVLACKLVERSRKFITREQDFYFFFFLPISILFLFYSFLKGLEYMNINWNFIIT